MSGPAPTLHGAASGGARISPLRAPPPSPAAYAAAEKLHSHVRDLARASAGALCAPQGSDQQWKLMERVGHLFGVISAAADEIGVDPNTLIDIANDQMGEYRIDGRDEAMVQ